MSAPFFYHPRMLAYDFGPGHPLRPERLRRAVEILRLAAAKIEVTDPGLATVADLQRVHAPEFVGAVQALSDGRSVAGGPSQYGFGNSDNPVFVRMYEASLAYCGGTVRAAEAVRDGAPIAFGLGGGLHHAFRDRASGFCVFDDPAIACSVLRDRFERVAYVDIDLHHGDGVQALFRGDRSVMTYSVHECGRTLFPGTGFVEEAPDDPTVVNVPLVAGTTGEVWLEAFERTALPALASFGAEAVVLQMGTDAHFLDPLGHLQVTAQEWLAAVRRIAATGLPIVALGGGGYEPTTVPRMWAAAVIVLSGGEIEVRLPSGTPSEWGMPFFLDDMESAPRGVGREEAEDVVARVGAQVLDRLAGLGAPS